MKATHKGWLLFCPVYMNLDNDEAPDVWARKAWLEPLLSLSTWLQQQFMFIMSYANPDYEPMFAIKVTGKSDVEAPEAQRQV